MGGGLLPLSFKPVPVRGQGLELWCLAFAAVCSAASGRAPKPRPGVSRRCWRWRGGGAGGLIVANLSSGGRRAEHGDESLPLELLGGSRWCCSGGRGDPRLRAPLLTATFSRWRRSACSPPAPGGSEGAPDSGAADHPVAGRRARDHGGVGSGVRAMAVLKLGRNEVRVVALTLLSGLPGGGPSPPGYRAAVESALPGETSPPSTPARSCGRRWGARLRTAARRVRLLRLPLPADAGLRLGGHAHKHLPRSLLTTGLVGLYLCAFVAHLGRACLGTKDCLLLGARRLCLAQGMLNPLLFARPGDVRGDGRRRGRAAARGG